MQVVKITKYCQVIQLIKNMFCESKIVSFQNKIYALKLHI